MINRVPATAADKLKLLQWERRMNPPLVLRNQCRLCGQPMTIEQGLALRSGQDLYAHQACVERESQRRRA